MTIEKKQTGALRKFFLCSAVSLSKAMPLLGRCSFGKLEKRKVASG